MTRSRTLDSGQTVSGTWSATRRATSRSSSRERTPWSIRSTPRTSRASHTYAGGPLLPRVRHALEPGLPRQREDLLELRRRVADLGRVQADGGDPVEVGRAASKVVEGGLGALVTQEAHDQAGADAVGLLGAVQRAGQAVDDGADRDAARGVRLRVEEDLGVPYALLLGTGEVGVGEVGEVVLGAQHGHQRVVEVQEGLEIGEGVGAAQLVLGGVGQRDAVALGEREGQLGLQGALDVQMQLRLGQRRGGGCGGGGGRGGSHAGHTCSAVREGASAKAPAGDCGSALGEESSRLTGVRSAAAAALGRAGHRSRSHGGRRLSTGPPRPFHPRPSPMAVQPAAALDAGQSPPSMGVPVARSRAARGAAAR